VKERHVVIVAFPDVQPLDAVGPHEVFHGASRAAATDPGVPYRITLASAHGGPVRSESGLELGTVALPPLSERIDTVVVAGGNGSRAAARDGVLIEWLRAVAPKARRVATVCSGTFIAAEAGLLEGRRVTTHWARAEELQQAYPSVAVDADPIYIRDGKIWTSAGVTAGIDLALAMVEDDLGVEIAQTVARWLVMFLHRPGGQTQFASPVWMPRAERSAVRTVQSLIEAAPGADHRLAVLAEAAAMSVRHFARVFTEEVGETPARFVEGVRLEAARRELETTTDTLDRIAEHCGFGTAETLRRAFQRRLAVSPDAYRRRFFVTPQPERTPA
jgi:transcriptional regulator GlxA family with amidase domain